MGNFRCSGNYNTSLATKYADYDEKLANSHETKFQKPKEILVLLRVEQIYQIDEEVYFESTNELTDWVKTIFEGGNNSVKMLKTF